MITVSNLKRPDQAPKPSRSRQLAAAVDVEWTKNYRIKNGNRPFCFSVVYLDLPSDAAVDLAAVSFAYTSVYLEPGETSSALAARADDVLGSVLERADFITGHQVCADFSVLAANADSEVPAVEKVRQAWHGRRMADPLQVLDTRYDIGHLLDGTSRRLVDVAGELALDVTQPELRGTSMTALHRAFIDRGDEAARERVSVLNLRHSLSTALVALLAAGYGRWNGVLNVNQMIADQAAGAWDWTSGLVFQRLLGEQSSADT